MSEVVATRPFDYAGTYRYSGEVFALGGHTGDAALLEIGYLVEYESTGDETEDDEGRVFRSERHAELAREHQAQRVAEREAKAEAKSNAEERFNARDALIVEERAVHGYTWQCPGHPDIGGCGVPVPVAQHRCAHPKALRTGAQPHRRRARSGTRHHTRSLSAGNCQHRHWRSRRPPAVSACGGCTPRSVPDRSRRRSLGCAPRADAPAIRAELPA